MNASGIDAVRALLGDAFSTSQWSKILAGKVTYSGPTHKWIGLADLLWGRLVYVCGGERLFVGIPLMAYQKELEDHTVTLSQIVSQFTSATREQINERGGFACLVESGDGLVIPPGYLLADINTGALQDCSMDSMDAPADVAVARQKSEHV